MGIRTDMHVEQKRLAVLDEAIGVLQVRLAFADRLDLGSAQGDAGLELLQEKVVVAGRAVVRGVPLAAGHRVARLGGLAGSRSLGLDDDVTALARHGEASSNLHPSTALATGR